MSKEVNDKIMYLTGKVVDVIIVCQHLLEDLDKALWGIVNLVMSEAIENQKEGALRLVEDIAISTFMKVKALIEQEFEILQAKK